MKTIPSQHKILLKVEKNQPLETASKLLSDTFVLQSKRPSIKDYKRNIIKINIKN